MQFWALIVGIFVPVVWIIASFMSVHNDKERRWRKFNRILAIIETVVVVGSIICIIVFASLARKEYNQINREIDHRPVSSSVRIPQTTFDSDFDRMQRDMDRNMMRSNLNSSWR
jgi:heme/copper-type cytochrome/quinol oxidase subunit 2